jgi:hypothetical protein
MVEYNVKQIKYPKQTRNRDFVIVEFPIEEKKNDPFRQEAFSRLKIIKAAPVNPGGQVRDKKTLEKTRYMGIISEILFTNFFKKKLGPNVQVEMKKYQNYEEHTDITLKKNLTILTIEVRGPFTFSGLEKVIYSLFDVIGPYTTSCKPAEKEKDFYLRTLINTGVSNFNPQQDHTVYFAGEAELELFKKEGAETNFKQKGTSCLTIKPIAKAKDAEEIVRCIEMKL